MISTLRRGLLVLLAALPLMANAAGSAHELVQDTTSKMLADLKANKEQYKQDPTKFYDSLNTIVGPVVDAEGISRSIMTVKVFAQGDTCADADIQENFKKGLFQFYGNACSSTTTRGSLSTLPRMSRAIAPASA